MTNIEVVAALRFIANRLEKMPDVTPISIDCGWGEYSVHLEWDDFARAFSGYKVVHQRTTNADHYSVKLDGVKWTANRPAPSDAKVEVVLPGEAACEEGGTYA